MCMFAVIAFGGKQYKVQEGFVSEMEKINGNVGDSVSFQDIVFVVSETNETMIGKKAIVNGIIARQFRGKKIRVFKKRQRTSGFEKVQGHRQSMTGVLIKEIKFQ